MRQSHYFSKTSKTSPKDDVSVNARLLEQGGFVQKVMAGVYTFLPLGMRVLANVERIVREEMEALGAQEMFMPVLHPKENWQKTGRWETLDVLFKVKSQHDYEAVLGPTHEEIVTPAAVRAIQSYKDLPQAVYQIQTKFRDEPRAKAGLLRGREFRMKDLYSFHADVAGLDEYYERAADSYRQIFKRVGLEALYTEADGGTFSKFSHEFQVEIPNGEDTIYVCASCSLAKNKDIFEAGAACTQCSGTDYRETKASEVGNIFKLKTKYSQSFDLTYSAADGSKQLVQMGCYGLGTTRLLGVLVEKFNDDQGIIWPESVAPFQVHLVSILGKDAGAVQSAADKLYADLQAAGVSVLYDDRDKSPGEKFADSDLIGIPRRIVVSAKTLAENSVEMKNRNEDQENFVKINVLIKSLK